MRTNKTSEYTSHFFLYESLSNAKEYYDWLIDNYSEHNYFDIYITFNSDGYLIEFKSDSDHTRSA